MARTRLPTHSSETGIRFSAQVWKEAGAYVAYAPELDVSSCGDTLAQARARLQEAVSLFLEEAARRGTLHDVLAEAGFEKRGQTYEVRKILRREKVRLAVPVAG